MTYSAAESNILNRRYELPTCLLEVWTERSPLSDWQSQIVAQNLRFRLQLANGNKVIKGNQQQIASLIEVITQYCDRWLAQDDFGKLDHAINIPKLSKLKLSTLQLFDLYESLELCANEFVILPNVVLEVRRLSPNWLKLIAAAIAIMGVSIGTIRLISPRFGDQPAFQVASTPNALPPEAANPPAVTNSKPESTSKDSAKVAGSAKTGDDALRSPTSPNNQNNLPSITSNPNSAIAPNERSAPSPSRSRNDIREERKVAQDRVAIAPEVITGSTDGKVSDQFRINGGVPSGITLENSPATQSSKPSEIPNKDQAGTTIAESSPVSPAASSPKIVPPAAARTNNITPTNIKVLQIQSELSNEITNDLVKYLQQEPISLESQGTLIVELEISNGQVVNISTDIPSSTLKNTQAIASIENLVRKWRSANPASGKIRLVLQIQK
ncbi:after-VIT domain-containing protein [Pseudanabaena sp. FACHB-1998]|uniref:after-VIT domain-containing protein n=1 Tax=Pseudanabaena sp. FACHB-1998 TaxID=2692858 RepID=UPI001680C0A7|nr:after-VIT domain-containing protein [Pseudanabaena sp. FACHB-1998]MBD2175380.1 after-VIT domain-containing protein [Pseudanabaena sp. FACHB-1998]